MSVDFVLDAELRTDKGKGASRRLRRTDKVPGIIYGGNEEPVAVSLDQDQVRHRLENEAFYSHILTVKVGGKPVEVVLRDLQRHPARPIIMHMDFQRVSADQAIHVQVPLHFLNEEKCAGVKQGGGVISKIVSEVEVACLPKDLPEFIEVDLLNVQLGESLHLSELQLPEGITLTGLTHGGEHDLAVVSVHKHRGATEEDTSDAADETAAPASDAGGGEESK